MSTLKYGALIFVLLSGFSAGAQVYFTPAIGAGYNSVQGPSYSVGADLGYRIDENIFAGVGAYYSFGNHPADDREIGVGPFVGYVYPLLRFLSLMVREDIDYVDQRDPYQNSDGSWASTSDTGLESFTYAGIHLSFTQNFGISAGYRVALGLGNTTIASGRSGSIFGLNFGF